MNGNHQVKERNIPAFADFEHMIEHFHRKYGFSKQEIKSSLKSLKNQGIIKYSTKAKNKPVIKLVHSAQNEVLFNKYFS